MSREVRGLIVIALCTAAVWAFVTPYGLYAPLGFVPVRTTLPGCLAGTYACDAGRLVLVIGLLLAAGWLAWPARLIIGKALAWTTAYAVLWLIVLVVTFVLGVRPRSRLESNLVLVITLLVAAGLLLVGRRELQKRRSARSLSPKTDDR